MCVSCVERIFRGQPAQCPVAGCGKTLRHHEFRPPTFQDLTIEREVDIRKNIGLIFNRREEEFEDLRAWNDYLNDVEDITFNLINKIDVAETTRKLTSYQEANQKSISENKKIARQEQAEFNARKDISAQASRQATLQALREDEQERRERDLVRMRIIDGLAGGGDATSVVQEGQKALIKRPGQKSYSRGGMPANPPGSISGATEGGFMVSGLKKRVKIEAEAEYDPWDGQRTQHNWVTMPDKCDGWDDWLGPVRNESRYTAGGYDLSEFYSRALVEAFSGLGVFVGEESGRKDAKRRKKQTGTNTTLVVGEGKPVVM